MPKGNRAAYGQEYNKGQLAGKSKDLGYTTRYHQQKGLKVAGKYPQDKSNFLDYAKSGKFYGTNTVGSGPTKMTNKN